MSAFAAPIVAGVVGFVAGFVVCALAVAEMLVRLERDAGREDES